MAQDRPLSLCLVSSEVVPFAKTGGLADVTAALARFLARRRHDVRVVLPMYSRVREGFPSRPVPELQDIPLSLGGRTRFFSVSTLALPKSSALVYAVRCPELYERPGLYTQDRDEHVRFAFLSQAALRICQQLGWAPDVVHCNDWHTGLLPLYLWSHFNWDRLFQRTRVVLTIHNIGYQGVFSADVVGELGLDNERNLLHQEDLAEGKLNFLKTGLLYANAITTVSETYAREIQGPEQGMGLDGLLRQRGDVLVGIVNGVDYGDWNPRTDALIPARYTLKDLSGKLECRRTLLQRMGLAADPRGPVLGIVSRLTYQKGLDLLQDALPPLLAEHDLRLCVLGRGDPELEGFFGGLAQRFPGKAAHDLGYREDLAHHIEAGADLFLMPSRYEPCGLNQMYSLKYGTVPLVRRTGGLADTVEPWDPTTRTGTGFLFGDFTSSALRDTLRYALHCWEDQDAWQVLVRNGMSRDFSWERQGRRYVDLYRRILPD
jgi:starch synthase